MGWPARADVVHLTNGQRIEGRVVEDGQRIRVELSFAALKEQFGVDYAEYFAAEDRELERSIEPGFFRRENDRLRITSEGQLFVRNICMVFDRYLEPEGRETIYSKTI